MTSSFLSLFDLIGTIAFALSGATVGVSREMDIFGVNIMAVTTACGGGCIRDMIIGNTPPNMFNNPFYVIIAVGCANIFFLMSYFHQRLPEKAEQAYDFLMFWFDTFGLGAFAVDGVIVGVEAGYYDNIFLICFLGFLTGVGGGVLRDIMCNQVPDIFVKHVYATATIAGTLMMVITFETTANENLAMIIGFSSVILLRFLANHFNWNLPKVE